MHGENLSRGIIDRARRNPLAFLCLPEWREGPEAISLGRCPYCGVSPRLSYDFLNLSQAETL